MRFGLKKGRESQKRARVEVLRNDRMRFRVDPKVRGLDSAECERLEHRDKRSGEAVGLKTNLEQLLQPFATKTIAVVWASSVLATVTIPHTFRGQVLELRDNYSRKAAIGLAASIMGIDPATVVVTDR